jgi:predicted nucleotidyltransferase
VYVKKAVRAGNSSAVVLPRAWLDREVRVELMRKTPEMILSDVLGILNSKVNTSEIIGAYLVGSYARGEEEEKSDIDILVITNNIDKEVIHEGSYNILVISLPLLRQKLRLDLLPIGQMLKEANPLLNSNYLESLEIKVTKENTKWYIGTSRQKLSLISRILHLARKSNKKYVSDRVAYTLILRIRTLYIIKCLIENKNYSKTKLINIIKGACKANEAYERYLAVKNSEADKNRTNVEEAEALLDYSNKLLSEVNGKLKAL